MLASVLLFAAALGGAPTPWHHLLSLPGGGLWDSRVAVTVASRAPRDAAGTPLTVRVGRAVPDLPLAGARVASVRVCDARGQEMLYELTTSTGAPLRTGVIPDGAALTLPAECPAGGRVLYYVYFGNPRAWAVPDYLPGGRLRNGGVEEGTGDTPDGWQHDPADTRHAASWITETSHGGRRSLRLRVAAGAEPTWISTRQAGLAITGGARYTLTAWVKARDVVGEAGWYIHVGNEANPMLISPMLTGGGGTYDWKQVRADFTAPADADRADLGTVLRGTGDAWFDDVVLVRLDGGDLLTATVSPVERVRVRIVGAGGEGRPIPSDWTARLPLRAVNLTPAAQSTGMLCAEVGGALKRLEGVRGTGATRLIAGGRAVPHYRLGDWLLYAVARPAWSVSEASLYVAQSAGRAGHGAGPAPRLRPAYAPNPALPGADAQTGLRASLADYAAVLNSPHNLARNASFEQGRELPAAWPGAAEGARPPGVQMGVVDGGLFGRRCVRLHVPATSTPSWVGWRQDAPVQPGRTYLFAAWLRCADLQGGLQLHVHLLTASGQLVAQNAMTGAGPALSGTQGWTLLAGRFTVPADCRVFQMHLTMLATGTAWHDGVVLTEVSPVETGAVVPREPPAARRLAVWPVNALVKVFREDLPPARPAAPRITCAGGEAEPLQLAVRSPRALGRVGVVVEPPVGPGGARLPAAEVAVVGYVPIDAPTNYYTSRTPAYYRKTPAGAAGSDGWPGWWPDPLIPRATFDLAAHRTQPVWVTFRVPRGAAAGEYRGAVRLAAGGRTIARVPVTVRVWGFALPAATRFKAIYDVRQSGAMWQVPGRSEQQTREAFWRFMAERRLCPDTIKPEPTFSFSDGKVTADFEAFDRAARLYFDELKFPHAYTPWQFYLFGWGHLPGDRFGEKPYEGEYPYVGVDRRVLRPAYKRAYQACLKAYWDHMKEMGWADRITLYISDEPYDGEKPIRDQMQALCEMIHEVDPTIPIYASTWHHQPAWDGYLTVWGIGHYGIVPVSRMRALRAGGATVWWTTDGQMCTDTPYCAIERLLPHYARKYGAAAYEFWGIDWLTYDPYRYGWHAFLPHDFGPSAEKEWVRYPNGDGFLAYPPGPLGLDRPVSSVRLEQAREGVEDYEVLRLLSDLVRQGRARGRDVAVGERALRLADRLVASPCEIGRYSTRILPDPGAVLRVKEAAARAIEALTAARPPTRPRRP